MSKGGIYKITNTVNGKFYIGSTNAFHKRKWEHFDKLKKGKHPNKHLNRSVIKYGVENFKFEILENILDFSNLLIREEYYINSLRPEYNKRFVPYSNKGIIFGELTEEHKLKISKANTGKIRSQEVKNKISEYSKKNLNPDFIYSQKNRKKPEKEKLQISNTMKGKDVSEQCRKACILAKSKPILQYDLEGNFIREFDSSAEAGRVLNIQYKDIHACCKKGTGKSHGFIFRFKKEDMTETIYKSIENKL